MKTLDLTQGSDAWHAHRANPKIRNASDAPSMMDDGYTSRAELLRQIATGDRPEPSAFLQELFGKGHRAEAAIRPAIEKLIGDDLYPVTGVSDEHTHLSASFDGITMDGETAFECKLWNEELVACIEQGLPLPMKYQWQLQHQFLVSGAKRTYFVTAKEDGSDFRHVVVEPVPELMAKVVAGWEQFDKDLAAYVPPVAKAAVVAAPVETLPAIICTVNRTDMTVTHNLNEYRAAVDIIAERAKLPMVTDQDFADRKAVCKRLRDAEAALKAEAERLIGQMAEIAEAHRGLKDLAEVVRKLAIDGENKVAAEEKNRKQAVIDAGARALDLHVAALQAKLNGRVTMPAIKGNFAAATKGLRTIASFENAVDTELANRKIEANAVADCITENLVALDNNAPDHLFLFRDLQQLITMPYEAFLATVQGRVATHKAQEAAKLQAERERIASEEREKAEREARAKIEAEERARREQEAAEAARKAADDLAQTVAQMEHAAAPAPVAAALAPPATVVPTIVDDQVAEIQKQPAREVRHPTVREIVEAVADRFGVTEAVAAGWLRTINQAELAKVA